MGNPVIDTMENVARGLSAASAIHQNASYLGKTVQKVAGAKPCSNCPKGGLAIIGPKSGKVGEWIPFHGLAPPGPLVLYSQQHPETKPFLPNAKTGEWSNVLWFSEKGEYDVNVRSGSLRADTHITITE